MTWFSAGASLLGAGASIYGNNKAAGSAQKATDAANALQQQQYQDTLARNQPFVSGGTSAYNALIGRLGLGGTNGSAGSGYGTLGATPTSADVMGTPGYQFGLQQGQNQLQKQLAASGQNYSGAALKEASQYGNDYATGKYQQSFNNLQSANQQTYNQLAGAAGIGQASANNTAAAGTQYATQAGNNLTSNASVQGAADLSNSNAITNLVNQGASIYRNANTQPIGVSGNFNYSQGAGSNGDQYYSNEGRTGAGNLWADGGAVGVPVVGTRSPLPSGGTGGGMSRDALIAALLTKPAMPQATGIAGLPVNPVMHPQALMAAQMQQNGAYANGGPVRQVQGPVYGPGGPKDDAIPVPMANGQMGHLSDGEHVFDTAAVNAVGNGDNAAGQHKLNMLRMMLKGGK